MKLERAQKIVESVANEERNYIYGEWDRAEAICTILIEVQKKLDYVADKIKEILDKPVVGPTDD